MNITYILLFTNLVMSVNPENTTNLEWNSIFQSEKFNLEDTVKRAKAQHLYLQEIATKPKKIILQKAMKSLDEAKHVYDCAKNLPRPKLIHTGYDVESFKSAVKIYDEETTAYNTMLETLKKEVTDAENRLLEDQGKYYSI